jgi:hypothetical protein
VLPAGLWGKVPGGDPYLLHVNVLTTVPLAGGDLFELQSGPPVQPRGPLPSHARQHQIVLVRPTDRLRFVVARRRDRGRAAGREHRRRQRARLAPVRLGAGDPGGRDPKATSGVVITGPRSAPGLDGLFHVIHNSAQRRRRHLPPRGLVPLDATMTFTRRGIGTPVLTAALGDTLSGGLPTSP